jgi:hypothetical protein
VGLTRQFGRRGRGVVVGDAEENQQAILDFADHLILDRHTGPADGLHQRSHVSSRPFAVVIRITSPVIR